ncbi:MAG: UvrD-helicase domain-containing protein [bacterium]
MKSLDGDQHAAVHVRGASVVAAGAGSGKTTVLAERYLSLISSGEAEVSSILTLTFTRKAAAEMHSRIFALLRERQHQSPRFRSALEDFDTARISTLDSFAAEVARAGCTAYGLPPTFTTDEDAYLELCRREALEFMLQKTNDPTMAWLTSEFGIDALLHQILVPVATDYMKPGDPYDFTGIWEHQQRTLERELPNLLKQIDVQLRMLSQTTGKQDSVTHARQTAESCLPLAGRGAEELSELLRVVRKIRKNRSRNGDNAILAECVDAIRPAADSALEILRTQSSAQEITAVYALLQEFQSLVIPAKQDAQVLGFADVFSLALRVLREQPQTRDYYRSAVSHIMIDEFQDNNEEQKEFIELVAGTSNETNQADLFFVGDEKQSIYRFRGADVRVFKGLSAGLATSGGTALTLATNYRSNPALISVFNTLFPAVFGTATEPYEAAFLPLKDRGGSADTSEPVLRIYLKHEQDTPSEANGQTLLSDQEAEALFAANYIATAVRDGGMTVPDGSGGRRPADYDDFAILLRTTSRQQLFEQMLRRIDVPYRTESVRSIYLEALANDLYALLQLCLFPEDRRAFATLVRSPLCGMSDDGLFLLLGQSAPYFSDDVSLELMSPDDQDRYLRLRDLYRDIRARTASEPSSDLLHRIWYDYGYRYEYLGDPANHTYLEYYDYLVAFSKQAGRDNLAAFLASLRPNLGSAERLSDLSVLGRRSRGVHLMTVHKSKGLQFPVVIVAASEQKSSRGKNAAYLYASDEYGLSIAVSGADGASAGDSSRANWFHTRGKQTDELHARAEMRRLLYVAMTRAEETCVVTGIQKKPPKKLGGSESGAEQSFLDLLLPGVRENADRSPLVQLGEIPDYTLLQSLGMSRRPSRPDSASLRASYTMPPRRIPMLRLEWSAVALNEAMEETQPQAHDAAAPDHLPPLAVDGLLERYGLHAVFGTLTHWYAASCLSAAEGQPPSNLDRLLPADIRDELKSAAKSLAEKAVEGIQVAPGAVVHTEKPFVLAMPVDERIMTINGVIDLAIVAPGTVHVLDFKTDTVRRPGAYRYQMDVYRRAATALYEADAVRVETLYLRDMNTVSAEPVDNTAYRALLR